MLPLTFIAFVILWFFDVQYFLRILCVTSYALFIQRRGKITDTTTIRGFTFFQDMDMALRHMNNARYVRDLDFARFHFYVHTGLFAEMKKRKVDAVQGATNIRYRRVLPLFTAYCVKTKVIYWDDRSIYLEQKFVTGDGFVRAIVMGKATMRKPLVEEIMAALGAGPKPEITQDLKLWMDSTEVSSMMLRPPTQAESKNEKEE